MPAVGEVAPDFTLPGILAGERGDYTLSQFRGRKVVLAFYPGDFTPVCSRQLASYEERRVELVATGANTIRSFSVQPAARNTAKRLGPRSAGANRRTSTPGATTRNRPASHPSPSTKSLRIISDGTKTTRADSGSRWRRSTAR